MKINVLFFLLSLFAVQVYAHEGHHHDKAMKASEPSEMSLFQLDSKWTDQNGKSVSFSAFKGKVAILTMAYTSCKQACPMIVTNMKDIESKLPADHRKDVKFLFFSLDEARDTPAALLSYAKSRHLDLSRWSLLHGSKDSIRELAMVLGMKYKRLANGDFDHSNLISVMDKKGQIQFQQEGLSIEGKTNATTASRIQTMLR